jgi:hypothetical protein
MPQEVDGMGEKAAGSNLPLSPVIAKLRAHPRTRYGNVIWPPGTPQQLSPEIATHFFSLLSTSACSLVQLLNDHPELPPFHQLDSWRAHNKDGFADRWREARKALAHFLVGMALDLQKSCDAKNAHVVRVRFDILKWTAARLNPSAYADKPLPAQQTTTVNVGVSISPERLSEIRAKLDQTRSALALEKKTPNGATATAAKGGVKTR